MRSGRVVLILALLSIAGGTFAQESQWLPRYDETSTGVSGASLELPVSLAWKYSVEDAQATPVATPAVGEEMVYVPVGDSIYAVDRRNGALRWEQSTGGEIYSSPSLVDGILYFGSRDNKLYAVNAADGSIEWRYPTGGSIDCPPVVAYGTCYFGSDDNRLTALDLDTRTPKWQFETAGDIKAPPLVYRDVVVVGCQDRRIYCLNREGRPIWSNSIEPDTFFASPVGERNKVIYASGKELQARDLSSGRLVWGRPFRAADIIVGSPCVDGRTVYLGTRGGAVYGIDANRGQAIWKWPPEGVVDPITSSPVIVSDMLVFRAGERDIIAIDLDGREMLWKYTLPPVEEKAESSKSDIHLPEGEGAMGGMPDEPAGPGGHDEITGVGEEEEEDFSKIVDPSVAVVDGALFVIDENAVAYGFTSNAPDNVPPVIAEPLLEVPGARRQRVQFVPALAVEDEFPERYADEVVIPGTPPLFLSLLVSDEGSGVDGDSVTVTINGEAADHTYDAREGLVWYIYDPRGAAANLANGVKRIVFEAVDWRGNRAVKVVTFTIDNKVKPPAPPKPKRQPMEGMPGEDMPGEDMPPGEEFPAAP